MRSSFLRQQWRGFARAEGGQVLVLIAVSLMVLMLMAGLALDVNYLRYQKQQMQKAADAAALSAAEALHDNDDWGNAQNAGFADATANGFTNGTNGVVVTLNHPPVTAGDAFNGKDNYIEAIVSQARPTFFMKMGGWASVPVSSRAIAFVAYPSSACMFVLDPAAKKALVVNGNVSVSASCGIYVRSTDSDALDIDGASGVLSAGTAGAGIGVVGGGIGSGTGWLPTGGPYCTTRGFCPEPVNIAPFDDPLLHTVTPPTVPATCTTWDGTSPISPGCYKNGMTITGSGTYTFQPGLYILCGGGMHVGGTATIQGKDVTFYNTGDQPACPGNNYAPVSIAGANGSYLSAPATGSGCSSSGCAGILFFQDRRYINDNNVNASSFNGTSGATFTGALYFPGTGVIYAGNPKQEVSSVIIAWQLTFNGNAMLNNNLMDFGIPPVTTPVLVE